MDKKIVIPTDFSDTAKGAVDYAVAFLGNDKSEVFLLNAYEPPHMGSGMLISINDILEKESKSSLNGEIKRLIKENKLNGYKFDTISEHGDLVGSLKKWSKKIAFDYVILGTKGASGIQGALFGSNASDVINCAEIPVISIPHGYEYKGIKKILFTVDGKEYSGHKVVNELKFLRDTFNAEVHLVHVNTPSNKPYKENEDHMVFTLQRELGVADDQTQEVYNETAIDGLNNFISQNPDFDLVCMVPRKESFIFKFSKTKAISIGTKIPLWTLRD